MHNFKEVAEFAKQAYNSGLCPHLASEEQAIFVAQFGIDCGLGAAEALNRGVHIIQLNSHGKQVVQLELAAASIRRIYAKFGYTLKADDLLNEHNQFAGYHGKLIGPYGELIGETTYSINDSRKKPSPGVSWEDTCWARMLHRLWKRYPPAQRPPQHTQTQQPHQQALGQYTPLPPTQTPQLQQTPQAQPAPHIQQTSQLQPTSQLQQTPQVQQTPQRKEPQVTHQKTQTPVPSQERTETPQTQKAPPHTDNKQNKQVDNKQNKQNKQVDNKQNKQVRPTPPPTTYKTTSTPARSSNHRTPSSTPAYPSRSTRPNHPTPQPNTKPPQPPPESPKHQNLIEDNDEALYSLQELRDTLEQELLKKSVQERLWEASRFVMGIETDEQASETLIQESIDALKRRPSAKEQIESDKQCRALRTASTQQTLREIWSQLYNERHQFTPHIRCELWKAKEWRKRELNRLQPHSF